MPETTPCELPDCEKPRHQHQRYCASHYMKKYRYGDPYYKHTPKFRDITGQRFGQLVALYRDAATGMWIAACDCGNQKAYAPGQLNARKAKTCGDLTRHAHHQRRDVVSYGGAHDRVEQIHGRASQHLCVSCGEQAREWAYDHGDPNAITGPVVVRQAKRTYIYDVEYSLNPEHYHAMCSKCHRRMDREYARRRRVLEQGQAEAS